MKNLFSRALSAKTTQQGFTLIELMIALVIGLVVVLSAGKLFLIGLEGFRTVEDLSSKQETMNFAANTLVRDIRRASLDNGGIPLVNFTADNMLEVRFRDTGTCTGPDELMYRVYRLGNSSVGDQGYSLNMGEDCEPGLYSLSFGDLNYQPLVAGFAADGFKVYSSNDGVWRVELTLSPGKTGKADNIKFYSVNRAWAINE